MSAERPRSTRSVFSSTSAAFSCFTTTSTDVSYGKKDSMTTCHCHTQTAILLSPPMLTFIPWVTIASETQHLFRKPTACRNRQESENKQSSLPYSVCRSNGALLSSPNPLIRGQESFVAYSTTGICMLSLALTTP